MLVDRSGRQVYNLRISVTQKCNQQCTYCHREGEKKRSPVLMSPDEIGRAAAVAASLGVFKVKFTGGEPLLREELPGIIKRVCPSFRDCSLTTNGTLLASASPDNGTKNLATALRDNGLTRVNISIDSLDRATYRKISGTDLLDRALEGVKAALAARLAPIKLNMVVLKGQNDHEIPAMMRFAAGNGAVLQLIELEGPKGAVGSDWFTRHHLDLTGIEDDFRARATRTRTRRMHHRTKYWLKTGCGPEAEVEVVSPVHNSSFCANCTRLRLSSDGYLVPCLFRRDLAVDLAGPMRAGASDAGLERLFRLAVERREPYWQMEEAGSGTKNTREQEGYP